MFYPLGKPAQAALFHKLGLGGYGQNKTCKERDMAGSQGWHSGSCASIGYSKKVKGTLGAPEYVEAGRGAPVNFYF
jgi:hypothetical protein